MAIIFLGQARADSVHDLGDRFEGDLTEVELRLREHRRTDKDEQQAVEHEGGKADKRFQTGFSKTCRQSDVL